MLAIVNRAVTAFASNENALLDVEPSAVLRLRLSDTRCTEQHALPQFWGWYRGFGTAPNILVSMLMALESWLLSKAARGDEDVERILTTLLERANNVAVSAVVASVATAYPPATGRAALPLLAVRELLQWDLERRVAEVVPPSTVLGGIPPRDAQEYLLEEERKASDGLAHRHRDLEWLARWLQGTSLATDVRALIDRHKTEAQANGEARDERWTVQLHRMDLRNYEEVERREDGRRVLQMGSLPPEVASIVQRGRESRADWVRTDAANAWAMTNWRQRTKIDEWRLHLEALRAYDDDAAFRRSVDSSGGVEPSAAPFLSAVCVRDHWSELSADEQQWCATSLKEAVERALTEGSQSLLDGSEPAATMLAFVLREASDQEVRVPLEELLATAVLSGTRLAARAAVGVGEFLTQTETDLALAIVGALVTRADLIQRLEDRRARSSRCTDGAKTLQRLCRRLICSVRLRNVAAPERLGEVDWRAWPWSGALEPVMSILRTAPDHPAAKTFITRLATLLAEEWRSEAAEYRGSQRGEAHWQLTTQYTVCRWLAARALEVDTESRTALLQPLLAAARVQPRLTADFLTSLIFREDLTPTGAPFWAAWQSFADMLADGKVDASDRFEGDGPAKLWNALFLAGMWKAETTSWPSLKGNEQRILDLYKAMPPDALTTGAFASFLTTFREPLVPQAFIIIWEKVRTGGRLSSDAVFHLERLLSGVVYGGDRLARSDGALRAAILGLLDVLIEYGSAASFLMRDDFLTVFAPASPSRS